jgi:hypothetical protein
MPTKASRQVPSKKKKAKGRATKRTGQAKMARKPAKGAVAQAKSPKASEQSPEELFVRGLLVRGEAVPEETKELPPGATHRVVKEQPGERPEVRRQRFSLY